MKLIWSGPQQVRQEGKRKLITVETTLEERFALYHSGGEMIPTMWALHDFWTKTTHFLAGTGWDGAKQAAAERINEILHPKLRKPRKKKR